MSARRAPRSRSGPSRVRRGCDPLLAWQNRGMATAPGRRIRPEWLAGLEAIEPLPGLKRRLLVYLGRERLAKEGIEVLPFEDFTRLLAEREL